MGTRNSNVRNIPAVEPARASIQPASLNGVNFKKTNLYLNNDAHKLFIQAAEAKALKNNLVQDNDGVTSVELTTPTKASYTIRLYGEKAAFSVTDHVPIG
jgi:hypothetical protein